MAITEATDQIWTFLPRFRISLTNRSRFKFNETNRRSHLTPSPRSRSYWLYQELQAGIEILCWFLFSSKNGMGLGTLWMNAIGEGCLTSLLASIIDFAIFGHTVEFQFPLQIHNPLEIGSRNHSMKWIGESHSTFSSAWITDVAYWDTQWEFQIPSPDSESPPNLG